MKQQRDPNATYRTMESWEPYIGGCSGKLHPIEDSEDSLVVELTVRMILAPDKQPAIEPVVELLQEELAYVAPTAKKFIDGERKLGGTHFEWFRGGGTTRG